MRATCLSLGLSRQAVWPGPPTMLAAALIMVSLLAGCAGSETYRAGKVSIGQGNYDQAVEELRKAVAREPGNMDYRVSLAEAESLAADHHVAQAEKLIGENRASAAHRELQIALDQMPAHPRAILMIKNVEKQVARCDEVLAQARTALSKQDWAAARKLADQALAIDASHPEAEQVLREAAAGAVAEHAARAQQALDQQDWDQCKSLCEMILAADPSNQTAAQLRRQAADRQEALRLLASSEPLETKGEHLAALETLGRAAALWPENETIKARLARIEQSAVGQITARVDEHLAAGRFAAAVSLIDLAVAQYPRFPELTERRERALRSWTDGLLDAAEQRAMAGDAFMAWPSAVLALSLAGEHTPRPAQLCEQIERLGRQQLSRKLSVTPLKSATAGEGTAATVARILADELGRLAPPQLVVTGPAGNAAPPQTQETALGLDRLTEPEILAPLAADLGKPDLLLAVDLAAEVYAEQPTQRYPVNQEQHRLTLRVRLRLIDVASARPLWSDDQIAASAVDTQRRLGADRPTSDAGRARARSDEAPRSRALAQLPPLLQSAGQRLLMDQARASLESAKRESGERATALATRCLLELPAGAEQTIVDAALQLAFSDEVTGTYAQRCREIAVQRLRLDRPLPSINPAAAAPTAGPSDQRLAHSETPASAPADPLAQRTTAKPVLQPRSQAQSDDTDKPQPRLPIQDRTEQRRTAAAATPPPAVSVFRGTVSREDDRFPKELKTLDGIVVKVDDTDPDPPDADLAIRVGNRSTYYKDQRVGARIRGRGLSGRYYLITVLAIAVDTETVHFSVEAEQQP